MAQWKKKLLTPSQSHIIKFVDLMFITLLALIQTKIKTKKLEI